jgi:hypothetical protein
MRTLVEATFVPLDGVISDTLLSTRPHMPPRSGAHDEYKRGANHSLALPQPCPC